MQQNVPIPPHFFKILIAVKLGFNLNYETNDIYELISAGLINNQHSHSLALTVTGGELLEKYRKHPTVLTAIFSEYNPEVIASLQKVERNAQANFSNEQLLSLIVGGWVTDNPHGGIHISSKGWEFLRNYEALVKVLI